MNRNLNTSTDFESLELEVPTRYGVRFGTQGQTLVLPFFYSLATSICQIVGHPGVVYASLIALQAIAF